ncbi:tudor domain-containing protein 7-like isoform X1 [Leptotrombidium deliense]|uniref:Tudor domain-containing protein 7-like isoform X1 n=1 Tax=Leptotrombidium deliense TaxID=299467 RepID=A0A443SCN3_9ACAR|nr:tudor domain-containing protein 7-like isoform X1 [Leptotrombidium deliense]
MSADMNTVKMAIRAVLQCNKHGLQIRKLVADYKELNGSFIPFKVFGYKTIEDFLRAIPDTVTLTQGQETFVQFTQCADTAHIEKLVRGQRTNKKKPLRAHAPKPLSSRRYNNHEGPARRETTVPRFQTRNRTSNYQNRGNQNNRNDFQPRYQATIDEWDAAPITPKPNNTTDNRARTNFQNRSQSLDDSDASPNPTTKPTYDWGTSNASSPSTPPGSTWSAMSSVKPRGAQVTSHFPLTPRQPQSRPVNNSVGENSRTQRNSPRDNHFPLQRQSDSFSSYSANVMPERTVVFENQNEISRNTSGTGNTASRPQQTMKPDIRITRKDNGITVVRNQSISSGSRASSRKLFKNRIELTWRNYNNIASQTSKTLLADLISEKQLSAPKYKSLGYTDKHSKRMQYLGIVEVGESKWLSHPSSFPTPEEAEEEAARKAYEQLKSQSSVAETGSINTDKLLSDIADILLLDKYKLMFHNGVEKNYKEKFQKSLPLNWLEIVGNSSRFEVERKEYTNKVVITVGLSTKKDNHSSQTSVTPPEAESATDFGITDQQLIDAQAMPDSLVLPGTETWDVIVTKVIAANEVIVRLFETSDKYVNLLDDMHAYYTENPKPVKEVVVGKIYAAKFEEVTYRVHVQRIDQNEVSCVYVDEGGEEKLSISLLHELLPKFLELPFQAFSCLLADLKYYASSVLGRDYLEDIINKVNDSVVVAMPTQREDPIEIKLYDTSNPDDRELNDELIQYLKSHYYDDFFKPGVESPVAVMNVSDTGDFQVQIMDKLYHRLEAAQTSVNTTCKHKLTRTPTLEELNSILPQVCCYSLFEDNWYRAEVLEANSEDKIKVVYPDYGNEEEVNISNLRFVDSTLDPLHCIPYLVSSKCRLDNVPNDSKLKWCSKTTEKYNEIIGESSPLTMKVIHNASNLSPPLIELFVTINNDPIVVNMKLAACKDVFEVITENGEESRRESLPDILKPIVAPLTNGIKSEGKIQYFLK